MIVYSLSFEQSDVAGEVLKLLFDDGGIINFFYNILFYLNFLSHSQALLPWALI